MVVYLTVYLNTNVLLHKLVPVSYLKSLIEFVFFKIAVPVNLFKNNSTHECFALRIFFRQLEISDFKAASEGRNIRA